MNEDNFQNFLDLKWGGEITFPSSRKFTNTPHFIGARYPCRSTAYVPQMIIEEFAQKHSQLSVLDPFMGSGTTANCT